MKKELDKIQQQIDSIQSRNKRVELDKAWEVSWTRKILVALLTYLLITLFMWLTSIPKPFLNALIPAVAYLISMNTLAIFKKYWIKKHQK